MTATNHHEINNNECFSVVGFDRFIRTYPTGYRRDDFSYAQRIGHKEFELVNAYKNNDINKFRNLINDGSDINCRTISTGKTLVNFILQQEYSDQHYKFLNELLLAEKKFHKMDDLSSLLHYAISNAYNDLWIDALLKKDFSPNKFGSSKIGQIYEPPIFYAIRKGKQFSIYKLLKTNIDLEVCNSHGEPILNYLIENRSVSLSRNDITNLISNLIEKGVDVNQRDFNGYQAIHCLPFIGYGLKHENLYDIILDNNADINSLTTLGKTPLAVAANKNNIGGLKLLIDKGACLNSTKIMNQSPIFISIARDCSICVDLLISAGYDLSMVDYNGNNILHTMIFEKINDEYYYDKIIEKNPNLLDMKNKEMNTPVDLMKYSNIKKIDFSKYI